MAAHCFTFLDFSVSLLKFFPLVFFFKKAHFLLIEVCIKYGTWFIMNFHKVVLAAKKNFILGYFVNSESIVKNGSFILGRRKQKNCTDF